MQKLRVYLDSGCFNRPFDDLSQDKIRFEREAILYIISNCETGLWDIFRSDILDDEIDRIANLFKKQKVSKLYSAVSIYTEISDTIVNRAKEVQETFNIKPFDALHLASAEHGDADVFLTTDKNFLKRAQHSKIKVKVANPATWLVEVLFDND